MFETFRNAWKIEDLRKKLLYTLLVIVIFRLGCAIPVPPAASNGPVKGARAEEKAATKAARVAEREAAAAAKAAARAERAAAKKKQD